MFTGIVTDIGEVIALERQGDPEGANRHRLSGGGHRHRGVDRAHDGAAI